MIVHRELTDLQDPWTLPIQTCACLTCKSQGTQSQPDRLTHTEAPTHIHNTHTTYTGTHT